MGFNTLERIWLSFTFILSILSCDGQDINSNQIVPINWTEAALHDPAKESMYRDVTRVPLASCLCDLTAGGCDINCCCDKDCSATTIKMFACINVEHKQADREFNCSTPNKYFHSPEIAPFLCIQHRITPYLGTFYSTAAISRTPTEFTDTRTAIQEPGTSIQNFPSLDPAVKSPLATAKPNSATKYVQGALITTRLSGGSVAAYLTMPSRVFNDRCSATAPVLYLTDSESTCVHRITPNLCTSLILLDFRLFLASNVTVLKNGLDTATVPLTVNYWCYSKTTMPQTVALNQSYLFSEQIQPISSNVWQKCILRSAQQTPEMPNYDTGTSVCRSVVQEVEYTINWRGSDILSIQADVRLTNVSMNAARDSTTFWQNFKTRFQHVPNDTAPGMAAYTRSGNPGYNRFGLLHAGFAMKDAEQKNQLDYNDIQQIFYWKTDSTGLCSNAGYERTPFGVNLTSACHVQLQRADFQNCTLLRSKIQRGLNDLVRAMYVSRLGSFELPPSPDDFLPIVWQNVTDVPSLLENNRDSQISCVNVTSQMQIDFFYAYTNEINKTLVAEIVGAYVGYTLATWNYTSNEPSQRFLLSNSAYFYLRSATTASPIKRYYLTERRDHCPSALTCWDDLFYPFWGTHISYPREYSLLIGLSTILAIIATYYITQPWWK